MKEAAVERWADQMLQNSAMDIRKTIEICSPWMSANKYICMGDRSMLIAHHADHITINVMYTHLQHLTARLLSLSALFLGTQYCTVR